MILSELLNNIREFYTQCSNRGWCIVEKFEGRDFLTLYSSDTKFTHLPFNFGKFPKKCIVSPKLSSTNIKKIEKITSSFDSTRLISILPAHNKFKITITSLDGTLVYKDIIKLYTSRVPKKFKGFSLNKEKNYYE